MKRYTVASALTVLIVLGLSNAAKAQATNFTMIGLINGQTLKLNIVAWPPNPTYPPSPCTALLGFQDSSGVPVGTTKKVSLAIGESDSLSVSLSAGGDVAIRPELLPRVVSAGTEPLSATCVASAEVIDTASGVTTVGVPGAKYPPNPTLPGNPIFGMLDVTTTQVARLNVMAWPPQPGFPPVPCIAQISFVDMNGNAIVGYPPIPIKLTPGQATFIDLPGSAITTAGPIHPIVTPAKGTVTACGASVEVYDGTTFATIVYWPPAPVYPPGPIDQNTQ